LDMCHLATPASAKRLENRSDTGAGYRSAFRGATTAVVPIAWSGFVLISFSRCTGPVWSRRDRSSDQAQSHSEPACSRERRAKERLRVHHRQSAPRSISRLRTRPHRPIQSSLAPQRRQLGGADVSFCPRTRTVASPMFAAVTADRVSLGAAPLQPLHRA